MTTTEKKINQAMIDDALYDRTMPFSIYLSRHPELYDGVGLDSNTINIINHYFYDYDVAVRHFHNNFVTKIIMRQEQYNLLRQIEFDEKLGDITTNERTRKVIGDVFNRTIRTGTTNRSSVNVSESESESNTKNADRTLPMDSSGNNFEDIVKWNKGASNIGEDKTKGTSVASNAMTDEDSRNLRDVARQYTDDLITDTEVNEQASTIIAKICNYLIQPKALDWLINELKSCFILVY